jgi:hypothetical protein
MEQMQIEPAYFDIDIDRETDWPLPPVKEWKPREATWFERVVERIDDALFGEFGE